MSIIIDRAINVQNTSVFYPIDRAVRALQVELERLNYCPAIIAEILPFAHDEGCLSGAIDLGMIDAEDIDRLTEAFVAGFDPVHESHPQWGDSDARWASVPTTDEAMAYAELIGDFDVHGAPLDPPPDLDDDRDWAEWSAWSAEQEARNPWLDYESAELSEVGISCR